MSSLVTKTAAELAGIVASGEASAVEVAQAHLDRIAAVDADVHAFLHVDTEGALAAASAVDEARAAGRPLGPLAGVPLAMKDVVVTEGVEGTFTLDLGDDEPAQPNPGFSGEDGSSSESDPDADLTDESSPDLSAPETTDENTDDPPVVPGDE